jgi:predicted DNA binding CopG/RHH family protein
MSDKIKYTNESIGNPKVIRDFLPSPEELAFRDEDVKITITLSKKSVEFFKSAAARGDTQYQRMIRRLLDAYVEAHAGVKVRASARTRARGARVG